MTRVYNEYDRPAAEPLTNFGKGLTRQSEAQDCDINVIMKRYEKTGVLPVEGREMFFADVSEIYDYRTALHQVQMANEAFMSQPAEFRAKFENDPAVFLDWLQEATPEELQEEGLIERPGEDRSDPASQAAAKALDA